MKALSTADKQRDRTAVPEQARGVANMVTDLLEQLMMCQPATDTEDEAAMAGNSVSESSVETRALRRGREREKRNANHIVEQRLHPTPLLPHDQPAAHIKHGQGAAAGSVSSSSPTRSTPPNASGARSMTETVWLMAHRTRSRMPNAITTKNGMDGAPITSVNG